MGTDHLKSGLSPILPGLAISAVVGIAATFLSVHYHASVMLFALLLGMALNFLAEEGRCVAGIQAASTHVLRLGVALLGLRITIAQVEALGLATVALVVAGVALTIGVGIATSRLMKLGSAMGTLTGGAVANLWGLRGRSPSPRSSRGTRNAERDASFTGDRRHRALDAGMIVYPLLVGTLGLDHRAAGHLPRRHHPRRRPGRGRGATRCRTKPATRRRS
jgi:hypothetical protein